jgi:hypothetical protein
MSISSVSSYVAPAPLVQTAPPAQVNGAPDSENSGHGHGHHHVHKSHNGGGQMQQALMQALQSLGLSAPQPATGAAASSSTPGTTASTDASSTSTAATGNVNQDLREFMHSLFQTVKAENTLSPAASAGSSGDAKTDFGTGLSALITQVSNGTAPAALQNAFGKLVSDLQASAPVASADSSAGSTGTGSAPGQPSLLALLSSLQQDLGYANVSASSGNVITTQV